MPKGPNIVLIVADDMGYGDFGVFNDGPAQTPHLDGLIGEGVCLNGEAARERRRGRPSALTGGDVGQEACVLLVEIVAATGERRLEETRRVLHHASLSAFGG